MQKICTIIYYHENNDDYMVILIYFIDIDHAVHNTRDGNSEGNKNSVYLSLMIMVNHFSYLQVTKIADHIQDINTV